MSIHLNPKLIDFVPSSSSGSETGAPLLLEYESWLNSLAFSEHTKRSYLSQIGRYLEFIRQLVASEQILLDPDRREWLIANYTAYLRDSANCRVSTINAALTALENFYRYLGMGPPPIKRERLDFKPPRVLSEEEKAKILGVLDLCRSLKARAIVSLFLSTGIRIGECAALNIGDVSFSTDAGEDFVHVGKIGSARDLLLDEQTKKALMAWIAERRQIDPATDDQPLFISNNGRRMSTQSLDLVVRKIGITARLILSAHVLRDTFLKELADKSNDAFIVAKIAGFRKLDSTRKYFDSSTSDRSKE
jgi:site-specific recombinase XerD